ncbi:MAG: hypothetical protein LBK56_08990 [Gracilibacteraceae bacterium]|jgi:hypothetical protein|nr:hypothetical protein [Gracilibacteraceae bacterium]
MKLLEIAHSRTGDKGDISNISVIVYNMKDYELIADKITATRVKNFFKDIVHGDVLRYEIPSIGALNFVMHGALGGGVTRSLAIDPHGKTLSQFLLEIDV